MIDPFAPGPPYDVLAAERMSGGVSFPAPRDLYDAAGVLVARAGDPITPAQAKLAGINVVVAVRA